MPDTVRTAREKRISHQHAGALGLDPRLVVVDRRPLAPVDVVEAIRYVEAHAAEFKVDMKRIATSGESAGGHIVAMIGARYGRELHLAAVVPFYPATDFCALVE